jgi:hypothetical protein
MQLGWPVKSVLALIFFQDDMCFFKKLFRQWVIESTQVNWVNSPNSWLEL